MRFRLTLVISVEISGLLEKRIRRLVDLGVYPSAAEAVRDAVRILLEKYDLRNIALNVYISREASLHYVVEVAGETLEGFIDYMISRGLMPGLGVARADEVSVIEGEALLDPSSLYVIHKSLLYTILSRLGSRIKLYAPRSLAPQVQILEARLARLGLPISRFIDYITVEPLDEEGQILLSPIERGVLRYALDRGLIILSDDYRVRGVASRYGIRAYSSLSLIPTLASINNGRVEGLAEIILSVKAIPATIPVELEERWLNGVW